MAVLSSTVHTFNHNQGVPKEKNHPFSHWARKCNSEGRDTNTADTCKNCAKCGKGSEIVTNEAYNIKIKISVGGILKSF